MIQRRERLRFSKGLLYVLDLDVRCYNFLDKLQKELIFETITILASVDELILKNKSNHLLRFWNILLFVLKLLAYEDLDACEALRHLSVGVFLPFLDEGGQDWDKLMADDNEEMVRVVGKRLYLIEVGELPNVAVD